MKNLLKADTDFPYSANGRGETPLYIAAASGNDNMVAEILENCPSRPQWKDCPSCSNHHLIRCRLIIYLVIHFKYKDAYMYNSYELNLYLNASCLTSVWILINVVTFTILSFRIDCASYNYVFSWLFIIINFLLGVTKNLLEKKKKSLTR